MIDYFSSEPMKYWSMPSSMSKEEKQFKLEQMIDSGDYIYGLKTDGNWSRAIITLNRNALQTRGISKVTGTYGEIQDKVLFWNDIIKAFPRGDTVILGEIYREGDIDKDIGAVLRCLTPKALARQKNNPLKWRIFDVLAIDGCDLMNDSFEFRISHIPEVVRRINSPLVEGVDYYPMNKNFFDNINTIFSYGGEGVVCYKKTAIYEPGKRGPHSWDSVKVKQEISNDIDTFIIGIEPPTRSYTGKDISKWQFWENVRTGEKIYGEYFGEYQVGGAYIPITKNYYYNWPGAVFLGVYDKNKTIIKLCKVAGLTDTFKTELRDNYENWHMCPVTIGGMMVSTAQADENGLGISIRHPYIKTIRKEDINPEDCTLEKILS